MSFEVTNPFPVFTDTKGEPLENGKLFIGAVDLNPKTNSVSVFFDAALTIPAAQPIRTLGGYPSRDGTPSDIFIAQNSHSITVDDKNDKFVFSDPGVVVVEESILFFDTKSDMSVEVSSNFTEGQLVFMVSRSIAGDQGGGEFRVTKTDISTNVTADTQQGFFVPFDSDVTGASGGFIRNSKRIIPHMFGVNGVGLVDDTVAFQAAMNFVAANKFSALHVPEGTYLITTLDYGKLTGSQRYDIIGAGFNRTKFIKTDAALEAMLTISAVDQTFFTTNIVFRDFRMEGQVGTTTACILSYGMANNVFENLWLEKALVGWQDFGAISCTWKTCNFNANVIGFRMQWFNSAVYTGDPNSNWLNNCLYTNNTDWGIHFNDGRLLGISGGRMESNGNSPLGADFGGLFVGQEAGSRIGNENNLGVDRVDDEAVIGFGRAVSVNDVWFENNAGTADIWFKGGANNADNCYFRTSSITSTNDIRITNGTYSLDRTIHSLDKAVIINEESTVGFGNVISGIRLIDPESDISYDPDKTSLVGIENRIVPHAIALGVFRISGADNTVAALGGNNRDTGVTSITRTGTGIYAVVLDTSWVLPNNPLISIQGLSAAGAAIPVHYTYTGAGVTGNFTIQMRRSDLLYDPTTDSINRDFQVIVYS